jgi:hypothetical protein
MHAGGRATRNSHCRFSMDPACCRSRAATEPATSKRAATESFTRGFPQSLVGCAWNRPAAQPAYILPTDLPTDLPLCPLPPSPNTRTHTHTLV